MGNDDAMNTRTCNALALPLESPPRPARVFFGRMLFAPDRPQLSLAGRELVRREYLAAVERDLGAAERRTRTLAGMSTTVPADHYHVHKGMRGRR